MKTYTIEEGTLDHIPEIIKIQEITWPAAYSEILSIDQLQYMFKLQYSAESLKDQMVVLNHEFLMIRDEEQFVGFASFSGPYEGNYYQLHKLYLLPSTQGKGAGRVLITAVEQLVKQKGGGSLRLNVNRQNKAKQFYEKCNYQVLFEEDIAIGPYWMNDYKMEKELV